MNNDNLPQIIGITGRKYNGKDTVADYLCKEYGYIKLSFAGPIKQICKILFGFNDEQLYGSLKEEIDTRWDQSPRKLMQYIGTELFRQRMADILPGIEENFWIKCLMEQVNTMIKENPNARIVIADVRFHNEVDAVKNCGYTNAVIRVTRPSVNTNNTDCHESELLIEHLKVDEDIMNDADLNTLYKKACTAINIEI
jgi:hypothetical protein